MPRLLIVDDDTFTRSVLENVLTKNPTLRGIEFLSAQNGEQGLKMFEEHRPDAVVFDLVMPKMDGFSLCSAIRQKSYGEKTPLLAVSGVLRDTKTALTLQNKHNAKLFTKPHQIKELVEVLTTLFGGKPVAPPPQAFPRAQSASGPEKKVSARRHLERAAASPQETGELEERSLASVLLDLHDSQATGSLKVTRGQVHKDFSLVKGNPVAATTNVREETLGQFLRNKNAITDAQHSAAIARSAKSGERIGAALIALGALTPERLVEELTDQTRHKIRQALRWDEGKWTFRASDGAASGSRSGDLNMLEVVLVGLQKTARVSPIPPYLAQILTGPIQLNARGRDLLSSVRNFIDARFADHWKSGVTAEGLQKKGLDQVELLTTLDTLWWCGALECTPFDPLDNAVTMAMAQEPMEVDALSRHKQRAREVNLDGPTDVHIPRPPAPLYDMLFGEDATLTSEGARPVSLPEPPASSNDSGIVEIVGDETTQARRILLREYLRVQGTSHYEVLLVDPAASANAISAALAERRSKFSPEYFARFKLGADARKLEELMECYHQAAETLLDNASRQAYDRKLYGEEGDTRTSTMEAELAFRSAQELGALGKYKEAIDKLTFAVNAKPDDASYHAMLGWAHFLAGGRSAQAADMARSHINRALSIDPDHADSHEAKGIISAELGTDDSEAVLHLEKALEQDPTRSGALLALERVQIRRGEVRALERLYRKLIYRTADSDATYEAMLWTRLGLLYRDELNVISSAKVAFQSALNLTPRDEQLVELLQSVEASGGESVVKAIMSERDTEPMTEPEGIYVKVSPRRQGIANERRAKRESKPMPQIGTLTDSQWSKLAHPEDSPQLGTFFSMLEPAIIKYSLQESAQTMGDATLLDESDLPSPVRHVRKLAATMLGVKEPQVYARADFGREIHLGPTQPPALLCGHDALSCPDGAELRFRLGRASSFLRSGRAIASSQPGRFLKNVFLAAWSVAGKNAPVSDPASLGPLVDAIRTLPPPQLKTISELISLFTQDREALNLSKWQRAMGRTADRVGLLLCGDLDAAMRLLRQGGPPHAIADLQAFASSEAYSRLRRELGFEPQNEG